MNRITKTITRILEFIANVLADGENEGAGVEEGEVEEKGGSDDEKK